MPASGILNGKIEPELVYVEKAIEITANPSKDLDTSTTCTRRAEIMQLRACDVHAGLYFDFGRKMHLGVYDTSPRSSNFPQKAFLLTNL